MNNISSTQLAIIASIIMCLTFLSCHRVRNQILNEIRQECTSEDAPCIIDLAELTNFEWEHMYLFYENTLPSEIDEAIGFNCACLSVGDASNRLVFTKGMKIVHLEEWRVSSGDEITFETLQRSDIIPNYSPETAIFQVKKIPNTLLTKPKGFFYMLYPIERKEPFLE